MNMPNGIVSRFSSRSSVVLPRGIPPSSASHRPVPGPDLALPLRQGEARGGQEVLGGGGRPARGTEGRLRLGEEEGRRAGGGGGGGRVGGGGGGPRDDGGGGGGSGLWGQAGGRRHGVGVL